MIEKMEELLAKDQLLFVDEHNTNIKHRFQNDKKRFIEEAREQHEKANGYQKLFKMGKMSKDLLELVSMRSGAVFQDEYCYDCGKNIVYVLDGDTIRATSEQPCFKENEITVDIQVPSGKLLFADWFENGSAVMGHLDDENHDIKSRKGVASRIHRYASENVAHFLVGNTCPDVYQEENTLYIGSNEKNKNAKEMGYVCTDLWWVTACDEAIYIKMAEKVNQPITEDIETAHVVVYVEPGAYRLRYFGRHTSDGLFATLEKIG